MDGNPADKPNPHSPPEVNANASKRKGTAQNARNAGVPRTGQSTGNSARAQNAGDRPSNRNEVNG